MKNRIIALAFAATAALTLGACNDKQFLTETPIDFVGPGNFYNNATDALAAVNGAYAGLENTSAPTTTAGSS